MIAPLPRMCVVQDTREQTPWTFSAACDVEVRKLDYGDYSVSGFESRWAIERKSLCDFVGSITTGRDRFLRELSALRRYEQACVVVEATLDDVLERRYQRQGRRGVVGSTVHPASILGTTWALCARYVPIYWAGDARLAAVMAEGLLYRWLRDEQAMRGGASAASAHSQQQASTGAANTQENAQ